MYYTGQNSHKLELLETRDELEFVFSSQVNKKCCTILFYFRNARMKVTKQLQGYVCKINLMQIMAVKQISKRYDSIPNTVL